MTRFLLLLASLISLPFCRYRSSSFVRCCLFAYNSLRLSPPFISHGIYLLVAQPNELLEGLQTLVFDDTPEAIADNFKASVLHLSSPRSSCFYLRFPLTSVMCARQAHVAFRTKGMKPTNEENCSGRYGMRYR
jgi:hypothetical protein